MEDQLGALGPVLNAVVLWNSRYIDLAVTVLRGQGYPVRDEDAARLSPLWYAHINMVGCYTYPAPSPEQRIRPLREPRRPGQLMHPATSSPASSTPGPGPDIYQTGSPSRRQYQSECPM